MGPLLEYFASESLLDIGYTVASNHTFIIRTLSQAGFELYPTGPTLRYDYFLFYPNPIKVILYILREHGVRAVFTSVVERIVKENVTKALGTFLAVQLMKRPGRKEKAPEAKEKTSEAMDRVAEAMVKAPEAMEKAPEAKGKAPEAMEKASSPKSRVPKYVQHCLKLGLAKAVATVVCHPLHVLAVRKVMDLVNGGAIYSNPVSAVKYIYLEEGVGGFFSGLGPSLACVVGSFTLMALLERYTQLNTRWAMGPLKVQPRSLAVAYLTYPLSTVATVMIAGPTALPYATSHSLYPSSLHCFSHLLRQGRLFRGCYTL